MSNCPMRSGHEIRLAIPPQQEGAPTSRDGGLVTLIVKAHQSRDALLGKPSAPSNITSMSHRHLTRMARLAYLAPDIITAILEGRQPKTLTARTLLRTDTLPLDWPSQRKMLGFG